MFRAQIMPILLTCLDVLSDHEPTFGLRTAVFRRFWSNNLRRSDSKATQRPQSHSLQTSMDRQPIQSGFWNLYAGVCCRTD